MKNVAIFYSHQQRKGEMKYTSPITSDVVRNAVANFRRLRNSNKGGIMPKGKNQGSCGGTPRRDGSGGGKGNKGTGRQPPKK